MTRVVMTAEEFRRRRRAKNLAIGFAVAGLAVLFFVITIVQLSKTGHL